MPGRVTVYLLTPFDRTNYRAEWLEPGTRRRRSKGLKTADPAEAERRRAELEYEVNHGLLREPSRLSWADFRARFESDHAAGLRPRSAEKLATVLDALERMCAPARLADVDAEMLRRFVRQMRAAAVRGRTGMAAWSQRNYLAGVRKALACAVKWGLLPALPAFPAVKVPKKRPQPVSEADWRRLAEAAPDARWRAYLMCGWWAGLRLQEAHQLRRSPAERWPWCDLEAGRIVLPASSAKADEDQWVPLHPKLKEALAAVPDDGTGRYFAFRRKDGGELSAGSISPSVIRLAAKAGVRLSMHRLRKGFGCRVARVAPAAALHRLMRHASMQVTMDFYASVDDSLHEVLAGI